MSSDIFKNVPKNYLRGFCRYLITKMEADFSDPDKVKALNEFSLKSNGKPLDDYDSLIAYATRQREREA